MLEAGNMCEREYLAQGSLMMHVGNEGWSVWSDPTEWLL